MFSIIICSVNPERLAAVRKNISETIGVPCELLAHDNRIDRWPIAKVYNECARKAKYGFLLFVHEDVMFRTSGWGRAIATQLAQPGCGVIGFAGAPVMHQWYGGWTTKVASIDRKCMMQNGRQLSSGGTGHKYEPVVSVDGFAMFVRRDVWQQSPFDEGQLTGFHCYDIDFCLAVGCRYTNFVCYDGIGIEHLSAGCFSADWAATTIRLFDCKWHKMLPRVVDRLTTHEMLASREGQCYYFTRQALRSALPWNVQKRLLGQYLRLPYASGRLSHLCTVLRYALKNFLSRKRLQSLSGPSE